MTPMSAVIRLVRQLLAVVPRGTSRLALATVLAIAASGASVALMGTSAWLLSRAAEHPPVLYLLAAAVGVRFFGIGRGVFRYLERLSGHDVALRMQSALRVRTYDSLSRTTLLGSRHGDLLTRVTADVEAIVDVVVRVFVPFCSASVVVLGASAILAIFNVPSALLLLATSVVGGLIIPWLAARWTRRADADAVPARGDLSDEVREISRCAEDLVVYGLHDHALDEAMRVDARLRHIEAKGARTRGVAAAVQVIAAGAAVIAGIVVGGAAVVNGTMLGRDLAVLALTPLALHEVFGDFTKAAQTLTRSRASLGRVLEVLEATPVGSGDLTDISRTSEGIAVSRLRVGWPGEEALIDDFDLEVASGERVAIVGPSGLGKTTLAATIMGRIAPLAGTVVVPGRVGYLAQDAHIFATSLRENVKIGNKDADDQQVRQAMLRAGLELDPDRVVGEGGATLSGGEAQRVSLARLLVAEPTPRAVILDEPTEHLDRETAAQLVTDTFDTLSDAAMLVITHDESVMARCHRIIDLSRWAKVSVR